jgi:predicted RNA-binding Zn-ribbon protein involved in translation (DUF1610 family)
MAMKVKCPNCDKMVQIVKPSSVGPEGATCGVYQDDRSTGCLYNPVSHKLHPWCPNCGFVYVDREIDAENTH